VAEHSKDRAGTAEAVRRKPCATVAEAAWRAGYEAALSDIYDLRSPMRISVIAGQWMANPRAAARLAQRRRQNEARS
jgi:hypothetical protein